ncbi:MAG: peptide ABC transporter substrate-binding protein [Oligoflexia bacterium]
MRSNGAFPRAVLVFSLPIFVSLAVSSVLQGCSRRELKDTLYLALKTEPPELNSTKAIDQESGFILGHVMEGLTRTDASGLPVPGVAESWKLTERGATFNLRGDARWSDGKLVSAQDFVFAWRTVVDPKTASEYAFILFPIKNAEQIVKGKLPPSALGVQARDDRTLEVTFEKPCGYFPSLTSFVTYLPVRQDFYDAQQGKYGADADKLLYNGPFQLSYWVHGAALRLEKNEKYWNRQKVNLRRIEVPYITPDDSARFNLFRDHKIDILELSKNSLENALREGFNLKKFNDGSIYYLEFNLAKNRATRNKNLRKAIQLVFDAQEYVSKVIGIPGTTPGLGLIPGWMPGSKDLFRAEYPLMPVKPDLLKARAHMAAFLKEEKLSAPPSLTWLTSESPTSAREAEYFQSLLKNVLGVEIRIDKQIFKQRLAKMNAGDFDIVSAGWGPDYADPMTFADLFTSWNENNRGKWKNEAYDALIRKAQGTTDTRVRMGAMAEAEKILLEEQPILPLFERTIIYTHSARVSGIVRRSVGADPDLSQASATE